MEGSCISQHKLRCLQKILKVRVMMPAAHLTSLSACGCNNGERRLECSTHLALISCREEFKSGEAVYFDCLNLVGCGVHLSHNDVSAVLILLSQLLPDGSQLFAVSTPRCIWKTTKKKIK